MADEPTTDAPPHVDDPLVDALVAKICEFRRTAKPQALIADELTDVLRPQLTDQHVEQLDGAKRGLSDDEIARERAAREAEAASEIVDAEPAPEPAPEPIP